MFTVRAIFSGFLIVLMLMTSGAMASARSVNNDATGTMVLCTGVGTVKVLIGADGAPVRPSHLCPECAMFAPVASPERLAARVFVPTRRVEYFDRDQNVKLNGRGKTAVARGPPRL
jgi:hypothetical protein